MNLLVLLKRADQMGVNGGLRLLTLGLVIVLLLLMSYYFLVINRSIPPDTQASEDAQSWQKSEQQMADAALMSKIKSALAQTKRLHGYSIGVECKEGVISLTGEVPTDIDKQLAAEVTQEILGVKEVINLLRLVPEATPQPGENKPLDLSVNVEDLELQANLRERLLAVPELKAQKIVINVHHRQVTLTGHVATESQKARVEELLRNYPKVSTVHNQLRIETPLVMPTPEKAKSPTTSPTVSSTLLKDAEIIRQVKASLAANRVEFSTKNAIQVVCQSGAVTLSGSVATRAERALAERLTREIAGVKEVKSLLTVEAK